MPERQTKPNQQQTCRNNEQNWINNIHAGTTNKTESTTDMPEQRTKLDQQQICRNNEQNRINNRHVVTMNKIGPTTDVSQQPADMSPILQKPTDTPQQIGCRSE
jgi:hypothetical protein